MAFIITEDRLNLFGYGRSSAYSHECQVLYLARKKLNIHYMPLAYKSDKLNIRIGPFPRS